MIEIAFKWMQLIGTPSIFAVAMWCVCHCVKITKQVIILQRAQKAQMRAQLLKDYEFYKERKYVLQIELDEWMNQYKAYHDLVGENEVLDDRKDNLLKLQNSPPN